jgi:hypothetical protein
MYQIPEVDWDKKAGIACYHLSFITFVMNNQAYKGVPS